MVAAMTARTPIKAKPAGQRTTAGFSVSDNSEGNFTGTNMSAEWRSDHRERA